MASQALVNDIEETLRAYEEIVGQKANRTRQMLDRHGYIDALSKIVVSSDLQVGFKALRDQGLLDMTFEAIVTRYSSEFQPRFVEAAQWRLDSAYDL